MKSENPLVWFEIADSDLDAARFLLQQYPMPHEIICFHCQQAAEKYLKGYLVAQRVMPPKIHDLEILCQHCMETNNQFAALKEYCSFLTEFAVFPRYPHELDINEYHVKRALESAETVKNFEPFKALRETLPDNLVRITCTENQERDT